MNSDPPVAVVTGANRGIGLEVTRQLAERGHVVVLGSRDAAKGEKATEDLGLDGVVARQLDVSDEGASGRRRIGSRAHSAAPTCW